VIVAGAALGVPSAAHAAKHFAITTDINRRHATSIRTRLAVTSRTIPAIGSTNLTHEPYASASARFPAILDRAIPSVAVGSRPGLPLLPKL